MLSASQIHDVYKGHQIAIMGVKFQFQESEQPHQYDFNEFQFDYEGVPGQAFLT